MLIINSTEDKELLLKGNFGLEKESLRITPEGFMAQTPHPFPDNERIVRDFCENQTEINTAVTNSPAEAYQALKALYTEIQQELFKQGELLWPFSNPPYLRGESDIPVAIFCGKEESKTRYRHYLSSKYGRYKMAFSGIHVNYSFNANLLKKQFEMSGAKNFQVFKNKVYLDLASALVRKGWLIAALTAASPLLDKSFLEHGVLGGSEFVGPASVRCSELGYWNAFAPVLNYKSIEDYALSIQEYVNKNWIKAPSELYYPVRVKPVGENCLKNLIHNGVSHIELRMFDLNPLEPVGLDIRDIQFAELFLGYLATLTPKPLTEAEQINAVQNFKTAASYDLDKVKILGENGETLSLRQSARIEISALRKFYEDAPESVQEVLNFEERKLIDDENRYAYQVRKQFSENFVEKGIELSRRRQLECVNS